MTQTENWCYQVASEAMDLAFQGETQEARELMSDLIYNGVLIAQQEE